MTINRKLWLATAGVLLLAVAWFFTSTLVAGLIISGLPRSAQGESVLAPKSICLGLTCVIQLTIPMILIFSCIHGKSIRIACLAITAAAMLLNHHMLDGLAILDKAWSRGW